MKITIETKTITETVEIKGFALGRGPAVLLFVEFADGSQGTLDVESGPMAAIAEKAIEQMHEVGADDLVASKGRERIDPDDLVPVVVPNPATLPEGPPTKPHGTDVEALKLFEAANKT